MSKPDTAPAKTPIEALQRAVQKNVSRFGSDQTRHKYLALNITLSTVALGALTSVLLGWQLDNEVAKLWMKNIALFLSALITVINAYDAFFKPRRLWVREARTHGRLKDLERAIEIYLAGRAPENASENTVAEFRERLEIILNEDLAAWLRQQGADDLEPLGKSPTSGSATAAAAAAPKT